MLDEYPEVEVTDKNRIRTIIFQAFAIQTRKGDLIANLKNLIEKSNSAKADEKFVLNVNEQLKTLINTLTIHLEGENDELVMNNR